MMITDTYSHPMGSTLPEPGEAVAVVRYRRGVVGETRRVCHVVPIPPADLVPDELGALCGVRLRRGEAEWLPSLAGMPCERCLATAVRRHNPIGVLDAAS